MILYNMGLAYHLRATKPSLAKALQMYTYALSALQHWAKHHVVHPGCHLLRLAILNNMAHANALLNKHKQAKHCLHCLKDIVAYAKGNTTKQEYAFFSANVLALTLKGDDGILLQPPAPAA